MSFIEHRLDGALVRFDRDTSTNVLRRGPSTADHRRVAPRTLQIGLLTPCNLRCSFCYRDQDAPSRLTAPFLLDLLQQAARWGVLEVAFGGGEPLLFRDFVPLLKQLHATTTLGLGFTTNGMLLTDDIAHALRDVVTELRVSAYPDNAYRATLRRLKGFRVGINWLVTPANVGLVEPVVHDALLAGAKNVLLLGYKGPDAALHLQAEHFAVLRRALARLRGFPLRLDICWRPHLRDVDVLFERSDCGASDEFLVITPDRAVQACSFADRRTPFDTFADLARIYAELRAQRPAANVSGCTRPLFVMQEAAAVAPPPAREAAWVWQAAASNNSGDWTIVARFCDEATAAQAAREIGALGRAHDAFLASEEGKVWLQQNYYDSTVPTPPLLELAQRHGIDWETVRPDEGLNWEAAGEGAPVLTAGAVGNAMVVFHPYCMFLPDNFFQMYCKKLGATAFTVGSHGPRVIAHARGHSDVAFAALESYLALTRAASYTSGVKQDPPWGKTCNDPRLLDDEDRDAGLAGDAAQLELAQTADGIRLALRFINTFAGSLSLHRWLKENGYQDIEITIEPFA